MPKKRKSKEMLFEELGNRFKEHAKAVFEAMAGEAFRDRGYNLAPYLNGELDEYATRRVKSAMMDGDFEELKLYDGAMEDGRSIADFFVKNSDETFYCAAFIECMTATIEVEDLYIMDELERFAEAWERERLALLRDLKENYREHLEVCGFGNGDFFPAEVTIIQRR